MEKRLSDGIIAGVTAGILKDIPDAIFHYGLKISNITFWDYSGIIVLGHHPSGVAEHICAIFFEIVFSIIVGLVFVSIVSRLIFKHYLLWGAFFGAAIWFAIRAAVVGLGIKLLIDGDIITTAINSLDSVLYGIILSFIIQWLGKKTSLKGN